MDGDELRKTCLRNNIWRYLINAQGFPLPGDDTPTPDEQMEMSVRLLKQTEIDSSEPNFEESVAMDVMAMKTLRLFNKMADNVAQQAAHEIRDEEDYACSPEDFIHKVNQRIVDKILPIPPTN